MAKLRETLVLGRLPGALAAIKATPRRYESRAAYKEGTRESQEAICHDETGGRSTVLHLAGTISDPHASKQRSEC